MDVSGPIDRSALTAVAVLPGRAVIRLGGSDRVPFLQGLVSNDVTQVGPERALWAALLTPQGKYLHDFGMIALDDALLLDVEAERRDDLMRRLKSYRLRTKVTVEDLSESWAVAAVPDAAVAQAFGLPATPGAAVPFADGVALVDPRLAELGLRLLLPRERLAEWPADEPALYERARLPLGIPDGSRDLEVEKTVLLEANFDLLGGISWTKGCYLGQEVTARTRHRGLVKRRLIPVELDGPLPPPGTLLWLGEHEAGELRSGFEQRALAVVRLEALALAQAERHPFTAAESVVELRLPAWASFWNAQLSGLRRGPIYP